MPGVVDFAVFDKLVENEHYWLIFLSHNFPEPRLESENAINLTAMENTLTPFDRGSWREIQARGQSLQKH